MVNLKLTSRGTLKGRNINNIGLFSGSFTCAVCIRLLLTSRVHSCERRRRKKKISPTTIPPREGWEEDTWRGRRRRRRKEG